MDTRRLLVVDNEEAILFALSAYFTSCDYAVDCARELEEAQSLVTHVPYRCVIADLRLSGTRAGEGLELVSYIRRVCAPPRVVILTAYGSSALDRAARARGADEFLAKPIPLGELHLIVRRLEGAWLHR